MTRAQRLMLTFSFGNVCKIIVIGTVANGVLNALVGAFT